MLFFVAIAASIVALAAWSTARKQGSPSAPLALLFAVALALVGFAQAVVVVPAGHVGVVDLFGRVSPADAEVRPQPREPARADRRRCPSRPRSMKEVMDVPSKEGLTVQLEVSALFHLDPEKAADVYRTVGTELRRDPPGAAVPLGDARRHRPVRGQGALHLGAREAGRGGRHRAAAAWSSRAASWSRTTPLRKLTLPAGLAAAIEEKLARRAGEPAHAVRAHEGAPGGRPQAASRRRASPTSRRSSRPASPTSCCAGRASRPR